MNIYEAINKSILEMPAVGKDSKNTSQGWSFRSIDAVIDATKGVIGKNGISIFPRIQKKEIRIDLIDKKGYSQRLTTVYLDVEYKLVSVDGTFETVITSGESQDYADKATGQAETFAFKSMLSKVFILGFEEDPDFKTIDTKTEPIKIEKEKLDTSVLPRIEKKFKTLPESEKLTFLANAQKKLETENQDAADYQKAFDWIVIEKNKLIAGVK